METVHKFHLETPRDSERFGAMLAQISQKGDVVFLFGELGAGKTSICRGYLRKFFRKPSLDVPSPSYLISLSYGDQVKHVFCRKYETFPPHNPKKTFHRTPR